MTGSARRESAQFRLRTLPPLHAEASRAPSLRVPGVWGTHEGRWPWRPLVLHISLSRGVLEGTGLSCRARSRGWGRAGDVGSAGLPLTAPGAGLCLPPPQPPQVLVWVSLWRTRPRQAPGPRGALWARVSMGQVPGPVPLLPPQAHQGPWRTCPHPALTWPSEPATPTPSPLASLDWVLGAGLQAAGLEAGPCTPEGTSAVMPGHPLGEPLVPAALSSRTCTQPHTDQGTRRAEPPPRPSPPLVPTPQRPTALATSRTHPRALPTHAAVPPPTPRLTRSCHSLPLA